MHHLRCPSDVYFGDFTSFQVSHCGSYVWICIIPCVILPFNRVTLCHFKCFTTIHCVPLHCPIVAVRCHRYPTVTNWGISSLSQVFYCYFPWGSVLSHMSHCHSLMWLYVILNVPVPLTWVALGLFRCSLLLTGMAFYFPMCSIVTD